MEKKWEIEDCGFLEIDYSDGAASLIRTEGISSD
jgi:hypothetical protein